MENFENDVKELCFSYWDNVGWHGQCSSECIDVVDKLYELATYRLESRSRAKSQTLYLKELYRLNNAPKAIEDQRRSKKGDYCLVTVNPPETLIYKDLVKSVDQFIKLKVVLWSQHVFEQRGDSEGDYHGFHTHIVFERNDKPSEVEKAIYRIFLPLVPDKNKVNIKWMASKDDVLKAMKYMAGNKASPEKAPMVANNANMRREYGLESVYLGDKPILVSLSPVSFPIPEVD